MHERTTLKKESQAIEVVAALVQEKPSVLVCMEAEPCQCHRLRLANSVASLTGLEIVNLRA
ncbi:DUF488 family protein [Stieleria neptunia]|uniref:DUF488 family protein n=1 Tax=Stieleria neptunia TaxID=2527979 RepID=UPI0018D237DC|nr:DUF488 family protein [Stieleria neptunia]